MGHIPNTILRHLHLFPTSTTTSIQAANISISQQNGLTKRTSTTIRCIHSAKPHQQHQQPPRSIWHHPYDDEQYLSSLTPDERSRIQSLHRVPTPADIQAESSGDDEHGSSSHPPLPARDNSEKLS